jgi:cellulose synthase/poly-beta-1,6-N-acetylglucosamine synthase-like glycosyltransferase
VSEARVTVVVIPRERFSAAREVMEGVFANSDVPHELVCVDGNSPRPLRRWLREQAAERGFELIRRDRYLTPNEARNLGLAKAKTELVVFLDNDSVPAPGWLGKLVECADETGAAVVTPLTTENGFDSIHVAGGDVEISEEREGGEVARRVRDKMYRQYERVEEIGDELVREQIQLCEFHCFLVRTETMREIGGLDEGMLGTREHLDLCLTLAERGESVWFEPDSVVAYMPPPPLKPSDVHFFMLRWSNEWERSSLEHFRRKWDLVEDRFFKERLGRLGWRRQAVLVKRPVRNLPFEKGKRKLERAVQALDHRLNGFLSRRHARLRSESA